MARDDFIRNLPSMTPSDLNESDCKMIFSLCFHPSEQGEAYSLEEEASLLATMQQATAQKYTHWRSDFQKQEKREQAEARTRTTTMNGAIIPKEARRIKLITAQDLLEMDIPPLEWLVDGFLPKMSVGMIASPPKYFKSYLCIDLALSICAGMPFLGRKTHQNEVLYCDLESTKRRPRDRIRQILGKGRPAPQGFFLLTHDDQIGAIGDGFEQSMEQAFIDHPNIALVIVDVLKNIRPSQRRNQGAYDFDYETIEAIRQQALAHKASFLIVHHTRKMQDLTDGFNDISGSTGILGACDFVWMIKKKKREDENATLYVTGRDLEALELRVTFDKKAFRWKYLGTAEEIEAQERQEDYESNSIIVSIKKLLATHDGAWQGTAGEIKKASKYYGAEIYEDTRNIGVTIRNYNDLLMNDGITYTYARSGKERAYNFIQNK